MTEKDIKHDVSSRADFMDVFVEGFTSNLFSQDIIKEVDAKTLQKYFSNPDNYQSELQKLAEFYYVSNGETRIMYEMVESLPSMNYSVKVCEQKGSSKNITLVDKALTQVGHKELTRGLLKQTAGVGTTIGIWLGNKTGMYPYIFDDLDKVFPAVRMNNQWQCILDLSMFDSMSDIMREIQFKNFSPYVTKAHYTSYLKDKNNMKYIELPIERTFVIRTGTFMYNQAFGTSWITAALGDILHKKKLKDVERAIANKIINSIVTLTIGRPGNKEYDPYTSQKIPAKTKRQITAAVKDALTRTQNGDVPVVTIPDYVSIDFPDISTNNLNGKFEDVNADIQSSFGLSGTLMNGTGSNHAGAKLNLGGFYSRIGVLLETIEKEVYGKLFNLILPSNQKDNFAIEYEKGIPLTTKERLDVLLNLNNKGFNLKAVLDTIGGVTFESFVSQTLYETDELKLQEKVKPYQSSSTMSSKDAKTGRPENEDSENPNTLKNKGSDSNNVPS